jgi:homoserine O-acetyltransferase
MVPRILPFCGSAKTSEHNIVFLEGVKAALTADGAFQEGWYERLPSRGLRAMARVYAGWGFSQAFYWQRLYHTEMGYSSLEDFLVSFWEGFFLPKDANNLLAMLWTWQNGDIGKTPGFGGDFERALGAILARAIVMPAEKDLYFPPEDNAYEVRRMPNAELRVIPGVWGTSLAAESTPTRPTPGSSTMLSRNSSPRKCEVPALESLQANGGHHAIGSRNPKSS